MKKVFGKELWEFGPVSHRPGVPATVLLVQAPRRRGPPRRVLEGVVRRAEALRRRRNIRRISVAGGETAYEVCRRWGRFQWEIAGSVERGVPLCRSVDGAGWLVLKPGGFGGEGTLVRSAQFLRKLKEGS
jgi:uncharacterized protein YgbK (DUF1537 family)